MLKQISSFFKKAFSKRQCGYRKGYNIEQCLSAPLKKWKTSLRGGVAFGALLTDPSEAFDFLDHEFIITKLNSYGFSWFDLKSAHSYLSDRKQRAKINNSYNKWLAIIFGVHQGSILGPLLYYV